MLHSICAGRTINQIFTLDDQLEARRTQYDTVKQLLHNVRRDDGVSILPHCAHVGFITCCLSDVLLQLAEVAGALISFTSPLRATPVGCLRASEEIQAPICRLELTSSLDLESEELSRGQGWGGVTGIVDVAQSRYGVRVFEYRVQPANDEGKTFGIPMTFPASWYRSHG